MLQTAVPLLLHDSFYLGLLCDDLADIFISFALLFSLPYSHIKLKLAALAYAMWCAFAFLNNIAIEVAIEHIRQWQFVVTLACLGFFGFTAGWLIELNKYGHDDNAGR